MNLLNIRIELKNPFDSWDRYNNLGSISGQLFQHKYWELEHSYYSPMLVDVDARWTHKQDHAGFEISVGVLGYGIRFRIYDTRHWDDENNAYVKTYR
jgi:hypothetical protein